uniref:Porin n=1 Tax=Candidatus Kentrum sp. DK TaxID=2126562 RepID=A0A450TF22_9GAMM|nr:MAG: hypothetical protein BECKDK2373C_GA0170839_11347 [Candidatus Kentron sp. DK]
MNTLTDNREQYLGRKIKNNKNNSRHTALVLAALLSFLATVGYAKGNAANQNDEKNADSDPSVELTLEVQAETSSCLKKNEGAINRISLQPGLIYNPSRNVVIHAEGRHEATQKLTPNSFNETRLRHASITYRSETREASVGLQQVVWGKADRLRILDRIHSFEQSELTLRPLIKLRRPDWMARVLYGYSETGSVEAVIIPYARVDNVRRDSRYAPPFPNALATAGIRKTVSGGFKRTRVGFHVRETVANADVSLIASHGPSPEGAQRTEFIPSAGTGVVTEHRPETILGIGFEMPADELVLRGEGTYSPKRHISLLKPTGLTLSSRHRINAMVGADWMPDDWFLGAQLAYSGLDSAPDTLLGEGHQYIGTLTARREFAQRQYALNSFMSTDLNQQDLWLEIEASWFPPNSNLELALGMDLFGGSRNGLFGRYSEESRVFFRTTARW